MADSFPTLAPEQANASHPESDVWLSASAGTGKTQVLAARVLRLLLRGARPEGILCLTFTKAGAAEMAERIHTRLGKWVTMKGGDLADNLRALGEDFGPATQAQARTLFAGMLDARGSGLRIQTIHSFCQSLLGSFPAEADMSPGFRAVDGREQMMLHAHALAALAEEAEAGPGTLKAALERLSLELGEQPTRNLLARCAADPEAMDKLGSEIGPRVRHWLGIGEGDVEARILEACGDDGFDRACLDRFRAACAAWGAKTGVDYCDRIDSWLNLPGAQRRDALAEFATIWCKSDGDPRSVTSGLRKADPECERSAETLYLHFTGLLELRRLSAIAEAITAALVDGKAYSRHYAEAKRAAGAVDFDDLIRETVKLLDTPGMGDWIRYKLDQDLDHILIDEAQDTNARQWAIVEALAAEFYAGEGARSGAMRTIFTVGDHKQAIFGFQGTDPREFRAAQGRFAEKVKGVERELHGLDLSHSFRSSQPILDLVDQLVSEVGPEALGLDRAPPAHVSFKRGSGQVELWPPVSAIDGEDAPEGEEGWAGDAELIFARGLAEQVRNWTDGGLMLRNLGRPARPEDVLILVRNRGELARLIVSRLHEAGVEVAGVDRLRLNAPIAVRDLLAAIRFVLQPGDDLNLAALLVSPLVGWDQQRLHDLGKGRKKLSLWRHIEADRPAELREMLRIADTSTPYRFLEEVLSGPNQGRRRLLARLGEEARDPIEALLNAALAFEREAPPSLQLFADWFDRGDVDIKRDAGKADNAVRVMTVHGAKGLQAPIVVLADAAHSFARRPKSGLDWNVGDLRLPLFRPRKALQAGRITQAVADADARELEEHWRLLYVALTRAEEYLFIGGAISARDAGKPLAETVWHKRVGDAMRALGATDDGDVLRLAHEEPLARAAVKADQQRRWSGPLPDWLERPAPAEARPPRPLAPSAAETSDDVADPPPSPADRAAAERGRLLHALFERLPAVAPDLRHGAALRWLQRNAAADPHEIAEHALAVLDHPDFAEVFAPDALAEAPIAGVVEGRVVAGSVDRLLVRADQVLVVDFKTGRRVPAADALPRAHVAQMAAYVAVLRGIFPDRAVRAALLYTAGPKLIAVSPALLDTFKPGYRDAQQKFDAIG